MRGDAGWQVVGVRKHRQSESGGSWHHLTLVESLGPSKGRGDPANIWIPGQQLSVCARPGFALFTTRSVNSFHNQPPPRPTFLGSHHWFEIHNPTPTAAEQKTISHTLFSCLPTAAVRELVRISEAARLAASAGSSKVNSRVGRARDMGLHDLVKWMRRMRRMEQYFPIRGPGTMEMMDVDGDDVEALTARVFLNPKLKDRISSNPGIFSSGQQLQLL